MRPRQAPASHVGGGGGGGGGTGALGTFAAAMSSGTWSLFTPASANMDTVVYQAGGTSATILEFGGGVPYDPINKQIRFIGCDHGMLPKFVQYDLGTNAWTELLGSLPGVHIYRHTVVNPTTGDTYRLLHQVDGQHADILKWNGSSWDYVTTLPGYPVPYGTINWHEGKISWVQSQGDWYACLYDIALDSWAVYGPQAFPSGNGIYGPFAVYHSVSVSTPSGYVFGGGNTSDPFNDNPWLDSDKLFRLNPDHTFTQLTTAPHRIGIYNGMSMSWDGVSRINCVGFGEHWQLNPAGSGTWTQLADPPAGLNDPVSEVEGGGGGIPHTQGVVPCNIDELGVCVYIQRQSAHSPEHEIWVYKP